MIFDILRFLIYMIPCAIVLVEIEGYFWHRFIQHMGLLGDIFRRRHYRHHEKDYPETSLRPGDLKEYKSAGQWDWYFVAAATIIIIFKIFPLRDAIPLTLGALIYAKYAVDYFHQVFHLPNHWLHKYQLFQNLMIYHDNHHYQRCNYGIILFFMDKLCGTFVEEVLRTKKDLFPNLAAQNE